MILSLIGFRDLNFTRILCHYSFLEIFINMGNNYLILTQYREKNQYNDFIGKFYHFPNSPKSYLGQFEKLPIDFIYYEPLRGDGVFYGCGRISKKPFVDKQNKECYFVEIENYKEFASPVYAKNEKGELIEALDNPYYNAQNAVRKIPDEKFKEICEDGGLILNFNADAHLVKVLGEQLISSEKVGILELIKNAIDAQASYCNVRLENLPGLSKVDDDSVYEYSSYESPVIVVEDDGVGMTWDTIQNGWLRPASTLKSNPKEKLKIEREKARKTGNLGGYDAIMAAIKKEHGRVPLGEKGVGRFATHRLGRFLELRTKTKELPYELVLRIDWDLFDQISDTAVDLNSIGIKLIKESPHKDYGERASGTKLIIYGGRKEFNWTEIDIQDLNLSILNLNPPEVSFKRETSDIDLFKAKLICPQIENLIDEHPVKDVAANFIFDGIVDEKGILTDYELNFRHPKDKIPSQKWGLKNGQHDLRYPIAKSDSTDEFWYINGKKRIPQCGGFYIHFKVWYRKKEWIDSDFYDKTIDYLDDYGGLSIYRDGVLVLDSKMGSEYDWLNLSKKHIKQGGRMSYRDFMGHVEIDQTKNYNLIDRTSREGLINNQASKDLAVLITAIIEKIIYPRYDEKRTEFTRLTKGIISDPTVLKDVAKTGGTLFTNISQSDYPLDSDPYAFFSNLWEKVDDRRKGVVNLKESMKQLQKSIELMEKTQNIFVEQAGFGIAVAISLHEINKITSNFYNGVSAIIKAGDFDKIKLEHLKDTSKSLRSELSRLSPLRSIRNEPNTVFKVSQSIEYIKELFERKLEADAIRFEICDLDNDFQVLGKYSAINQVLGNLLDNSIYWIKYSGNNQRIIRIILDKNLRTLVFADSGSDINEIIRPSLFQPGYSLKTPPSGLGLYICKTYLDAMKARIYETPFKDRSKDLPGAHFTLDFHKTPQEKL